MMLQLALSLLCTAYCAATSGCGLRDGGKGCSNSVIHNGGTEVEKCDAPQVMAEGFSMAVAKDGYFIVCQYAFWTLRPG